MIETIGTRMEKTLQRTGSFGFDLFRVPAVLRSDRIAFRFLPRGSIEHQGRDVSWKQGPKAGGALNLFSNVLLLVREKTAWSRWDCIVGYCRHAIGGVGRRAECSSSMITVRCSVRCKSVRGPMRDDSQLQLTNPH